MGKKRYIIVSIICFFVIFLGILTVSSNLPKAVKDNSPYKIDFSIYPFKFEYSNDQYKISAEKELIENVFSRFNRVVK